MTIDDKRHPEAMSKTCCCDEENHKTSSKANVKDCCRSEEGGKTSSWARAKRIYYRGEESGKKIKAISYKLLAISCELKAEAYDFH